MKKKVVFEFGIHDMDFEKDGIIKHINNVVCAGIVYPDQEELMSGEIKVSVGKNARIDVTEFLERPESHGKSIFIYGTYERKNGVNLLYFIRVLQHQYVGEELVIHGSSKDMLKLRRSSGE